MDADDPTTPLLGASRRGPRLCRVARKLCSLESWRRRLPIIIWLPKYEWHFLLKDAIAGITVGLTSIPQGIAYAIVAGVPPQVGLYSSIFPGFVYVLFGSVKDVTVGPTAILAALVAKYVAYSVDFAYLAAFLSGCIILLLGALQLGFLLDFISKQVISGFTTAAALQIAAAQLKSLCRISGSSGGTFISAVINFVKNIKTVQLWDTLLGLFTIVLLVLLKCAPAPRAGRAAAAARYTVRARNALVVFAATLLAYGLYLHDITPFALTGKIEGGLPHFGPPPFSTTVKNETIHFEGMLEVFGPEGLVMPLVAILETIAIAKAFAGSASVDATQEMIAIGACNLVSSFCQSMPATGSFTRTALNHASGVVTPAGAFFKACLVLLSVTLLTDAFYFIPRATLAGVIMVAMVYIVEVDIVKKLWKNSKMEFVVYLVTLVTGACAGLEYGILAGAAADVVRLMAQAARPRILVDVFKVGHTACVSLTPAGHVTYAGAQRVASLVRTRARAAPVVTVHGHRLHHLDIAVAESLVDVMKELEKEQHRFLLWNFPDEPRLLLIDLWPDIASRFVDGHTIDWHVLQTNVPSLLQE